MNSLQGVPYLLSLSGQLNPVLRNCLCLEMLSAMEMMLLTLCLRGCPPYETGEARDTVSSFG